MAIHYTTLATPPIFITLEYFYHLGKEYKNELEEMLKLIFHYI